MNARKGVIALGITAQGRNELIAHREGRKLTRGQAIKAKCYECAGGFTDGKADCAIPHCPLYSFMAYRKTTPAGNSVAVEARGRGAKGQSARRGDKPMTAGLCEEQRKNNEDRELIGRWKRGLPPDRISRKPTT